MTDHRPNRRWILVAVAFVALVAAAGCIDASGVGTVSAGDVSGGADETTTRHYPTTDSNLPVGDQVTTTTTTTTTETETETETDTETSTPTPTPTPTPDPAPASPTTTTSTPTTTETTTTETSTPTPTPAPGEPSPDTEIATKLVAEKDVDGNLEVIVQARNLMNVPADHVHVTFRGYAADGETVVVERTFCYNRLEPGAGWHDGRIRHTFHGVAASDVYRGTLTVEGDYVGEQVPDF